MTKHCNSCSSQQESWAEHPSYAPLKVFRRDERCWKCDRWTLQTRMQFRDVFTNPNNIHLPFLATNLLFAGINTIMGKDLESQIQRITGTKEVIIDIAPFETWWNKNVGTVISARPHILWLVVHESSQNKIEGLTRGFEISRGYDRYDVSSVENRAREIRNNLNGENPILVLYEPSYTCSYRDFINNDNLFTSYKVGSSNFSGVGGSEWKLIGVSSVSIPNNLDDYVKFLDIIKIEKTHKIYGKTYSHAGIYLKRNQVFHFYDWGKQKYMKVRIDDIEKFVEENSTSVATGEIVCYHPNIPFKHYRKIIEHIVKANYVDYWKGEYSLGGRNCEHLANKVSKGIYLSEQVSESPFLGGASLSIGVSSENLKNKIESSSRELSNLTSLELRSERDRYENRVEIPPKKDCQIM